MFEIVLILSQHLLRVFSVVFFLYRRGARWKIMFVRGIFYVAAGIKELEYHNKSSYFLTYKLHSHPIKV